MKKLVLGLLITLCAAMANAYVLTWQVDLDEPNTSYAYAVLYGTSGGNDTALAAMGMSNGASAGPLATTINATSDTPIPYDSFYVQMVDSSLNPIASAKSESSTWDSLATSGALNNATSQLFPGNSSWIVTSVVPEPTSALLFGVGAALLAVRRRKIKA